MNTVAIVNTHSVVVAEPTNICKEGAARAALLTQAIASLKIALAQYEAELSRLTAQ